MRNERRELNDIKFEFLPDRDSPEGIAGELVGAGLVHQSDQTAGEYTCALFGVAQTFERSYGYVRKRKPKYCRLHLVGYDAGQDIVIIDVSPVFSDSHKFYNLTPVTQLLSLASVGKNP